jgi:cobalt-zinc-cadmium efflux system outer membrane protein
VARIELARQLGASVEAVGPLVDPLATVGPTPPLEQLLADAARLHPELRAVERERSAALARGRAARADRRPIPVLEAGFELLDPSTCGTATHCAGPRGALAFDLPVLNLNGGPIARAQAEAQLAELKRWAVSNRITATVRAAYETFNAAVVRARFFDAEYLPAALEVEAMAREGFAIGRSGLLPLIEAERAVLEARLGRAQALYAVQVARADLEEASGVPLSAP